MTDEAIDVLDPQEATQQAITLNPVLSIPDQAPTAGSASQLARALTDILPSSWDPKHPSADLYQKAQDALAAYALQQK